MMNNFRYIFILALITIAFSLKSPVATAHVTVEPKEIGVGKTLKLTVDVPTELENKSTVAVRLVLPKTMTIGRYIKSGWNVALKSVPGGPENQASEITWSGGNIPYLFREEFEFYTQIPSDETNLIWKAYQTYDDGSVTAWVLDPKAELPTDDKGNYDFSKFGPYSEMKVINDLNEQPKVVKDDDKKAQNALLLGIVAIAISTISLGIHIYKK
jgi:uncharacterized protein YcnI